MAKKKKCLKCGHDKLEKHFYTSYSKLHGDGKVPYCKECLREMIDVNDIDSVKNVLRQVDRPFLYDYWESSLNGDKDTVGVYFKNLSLPQNRSLTWQDSNFGENNEDFIDVDYNSKQEEKGHGLTEEQIEKLEEKWGFGYEPKELKYFEKKYRSLKANYPIKTSLHDEALKTYCIYKVRAELSTAEGNVKDAKEWGAMAQRQGEIAKINPNKLTKSDLSQGLDGFGQLARMVEQAVDIIPVLPKFIEKPQDKIDFAIMSFINYERRLKGLSDVTHDEIYDFYQDQIKEYANKEGYEFLIKEVEIDTPKGKKKILTIDIDDIIKQKQLEHPEDDFVQNLHKWVELTSFYRFYPDLWYDLITPEQGGIRLDADQRFLLRCEVRFKQTYGVFPRGYGKTLIELMEKYHTAIWYPDVEVSMTAQTRENASKLIDEKHREIVKFYPLIREELTREPKISKDMAEVTFKSGGRLDILANQQSTKGARRKRLTIEESALLNNALFQDVLEPIVNIPRRTLGKMAIVNPMELNGQINFFTTSGFRGTDEFERNLALCDEMVELKGKMVLGSDWQLACEFGRGETKNQILEKRDKLSPVFFAMNYESRWVGATDGALVNMKKVMDLRTLSKVELKGDKKSDYIIAVDVARSQNTNNNQCSIVILKLQRNKEGKIKSIKLVNMINIPSMLNFKVQAQIIMKVKNLYDAKAVVVDGNGLGKGLIDQLVLEQIDPNTNESLGCYRVMNTDQESELDDAEEILYDLKAQSNNSEVIVNFIGMVDGGVFELLEKRTDGHYDIEDEDYFENEILPYVQTDYLLEEISNLKLKQLPSGKYTIEQVTKRINKDRFSALAYGLWYIKEFEEDGGYQNTDIDATDFLLIN